MTADVWSQLRVEVKRDRFGRYLVKGKPYTRVTTFAATVDDRHNLELWGRRMVAAGLVDRSDLFAQAAANHDDKKALNRICDEAIEAAKGSAGANTGSALHLFTERVDRGEDFTPPAPWNADLDIYQATLRANGVQIVDGMIEQIVVNHTFGIAGTFDRLVTIDGFDRPLVADLKTGSVDHSWGAIAVQLACYSNADELYDPATDTTMPMVDVDTDFALVVHLPAGQAACTLYLVDIREGWQAAHLCQQVRDWRQNKTLAKPFRTPDRRTVLAGRVERLRDRYPDALADLAAMWPADVPTFKSGVALSDDNLNLIALAISTVEAKHQVAFGETDPADRRPDAATLDMLWTRLAALPADLLEAVNEAAQRLGLPNVRSRQFRQQHVDDAEALVVDAEAASAQRWNEARPLIESICGGDQSLQPAVFAACGVTAPSETWTRQQLDILYAVHTAAESQHLVWVDGVLCCDNGEGQLTDWFGNKRQALAAVKTLADTFGLSRPKSVAEAAVNPTLIALAANAVTTPTS